MSCELFVAYLKNNSILFCRVIQKLRIRTRVYAEMLVNKENSQAFLHIHEF